MVADATAWPIARHELVGRALRRVDMVGTEVGARAFELVVTPALFALIGHVIDRWLGTGFVFTLALTVFCVVGMSIRMVYGYNDAMKQHEAEAVWRRTNRAEKVAQP
jgi:hypothetical protein